MMIYVVVFLTSLLVLFTPLFTFAVELTGDLIVQIDDHPGQVTQERFILVTPTRRIEVQFIKPNLLRPQRGITISGVWSKSRGDVLEQAVVVRTTPGLKNLTLPFAPVVGTKRLGVIAWTVNGVHPPTTDLTELFFGSASDTTTSSLYRFSGGQLTLTGEVWGWYATSITEPANISFCSVMGQTEAYNAAIAAGFDPSQYYVIYFIEHGSRCLARGWGSTGISDSQASSVMAGSSLDDRYLAQSVIIHELGHQFRPMHLWHAGQLECTDATGAFVPFSQTCVVRQYADCCDPMHSGGTAPVPSFSGPHKVRLGWITPTLITTSGEYDLRENNTLRIGGAPDIRIGVGVTGTRASSSYWIDSGPIIRIAPTDIVFYDGSLNTTGLILGPPETPGLPFRLEQLPVGATFTDPVIALRITALSSTRVSVTFIEPLPGVPVAPSALTVH